MAFKSTTVVIILLLSKLCFAGALDIITNPKLVWVVDNVLSHLHVYYDATADGVVYSSFIKGDRVYGADPKAWHRYKSMSRLCLVGKGCTIAAMAYNCMVGKMKWSDFIGHNTTQLAALNFTWHRRWNHVRYNNTFDTSLLHNSSRYVIPIPKGGDIKIALSGAEVTVADMLELSIGSFGLAKFSPNLFGSNK